MKRQTNQSFSRMTAAQKRVAIAKDVIKQIRAGQYDIQKGTWLDLTLPDSELSDSYTPEQTQALLLGKPVVINRKPIQCQCCAIGAACASAVRLFNRHAIEDGILFNRFLGGTSLLSPYFSHSQCVLIEAAFENRSVYSADDEPLGERTKEALSKFQEAHSDEDDEERAISIFTNIIRNRGDFVL